MYIFHLYLEFLTQSNYKYCSTYIYTTSLYNFYLKRLRREPASGMYSRIFLLFLSRDPRRLIEKLDVAIKQRYCRRCEKSFIKNPITIDIFLRTAKSCSA